MTVDLPPLEFAEVDAESGPEVRAGPKRAHARVESDIACVVDGTTEARIRNLSLGGALLRAPPGLGELDDTVSLEFQVGEVEPLAIWGEVVRITANEPNTDYGIRLVAIEPAHAHKLLRCIDLLMSGRGVGRRDAPRLYRRVELRCRTADDFYATMNDISPGGLGLECEVPVEIGEEVSVQLLVGPHGAGLELTGVVTHTRVAEHGLHRAGLRFAPLGPDVRGRLEALLRSMVVGR